MLRSSLRAYRVSGCAIASPTLPRTARERTSPVTPWHAAHAGAGCARPCRELLAAAGRRVAVGTAHRLSDSAAGERGADAAHVGDELHGLERRQVLARLRADVVL